MSLAFGFCFGACHGHSGTIVDDIVHVFSWFEGSETHRSPRGIRGESGVLGEGDYLLASLALIASSSALRDAISLSFEYDDLNDWAFSILSTPVFLRRSPTVGT
jgi:hypothetical protein